MFLLVSKFKTIKECYCALCTVTPKKSEQKHLTKNSDRLYNHCYVLTIRTCINHCKEMVS